MEAFENRAQYQRCFSILVAQCHDSRRIQPSVILALNFTRFDLQTERMADFGISGHGQRHVVDIVLKTVNAYYQDSYVTSNIITLPRRNPPLQSRIWNWFPRIYGVNIRDRITLHFPVWSQMRRAIEPGVWSTRRTMPCRPRWVLLRLPALTMELVSVHETRYLIISDSTRKSIVPVWILLDSFRSTYG